MSYVPPEAVPICAADGTGVEDLLHVLDAAAWAEKGSAVESFCSFIGLFAVVGYGHFAPMSTSLVPDSPACRRRVKRRRRKARTVNRT